MSTPNAIDWDAILTADYLNFANGLRGTAYRAEALEAIGIDPESSDDRDFNAEYVYCGSHYAAHRAGWCTVGNDQKAPLSANSLDDAMAECRERNLKLDADRLSAESADN